MKGLGCLPPLALIENAPKVETVRHPCLRQGRGCEALSSRLRSYVLGDCACVLFDFSKSAKLAEDFSDDYQLLLGYLLTRLECIWIESGNFRIFQIFTRKYSFWSKFDSGRGCLVDR